MSRKVGKAAVLPTAPAFSFGKRLERPPREILPGPGQYESSELYLNRADLERSPPRSPRPAGSSVSVRRSIGDVSLGRPPSSLRAYSPFPNTSMTSSDFPRPQGVTPPRVSSARRASGGVAPLNNVPGPGAYDPSVDAVRQRRTSWSMSRSPRMAGSTPPSPGPNEYGAMGPVLNYSAGHDVSSVHRSVPAFSFGHDPYGRAIVAQGQPLHCRSVLTGHGIPKDNPGPTDYDPRNPGLLAPRVFTIKGTTVKDPRTGLPGPGNYEHTRADVLVRRSTPQPTLSRRLPPQAVGGGIITSSTLDRCPGPGRYSPKLDPSVPGQQKGATLKARHPLSDEAMEARATPAPHDYADKDFYGGETVYGSCSRGAGFTMGGRLRPSRREAVPGPQYTVGCSTLGVAVPHFESPEESLRTSVL